MAQINLSSMLMDTALNTGNKINFADKSSFESFNKTFSQVKESTKVKSSEDYSKKNNQSNLKENHYTKDIEKNCRKELDNSNKADNKIDNKVDKEETEKSDEVTDEVLALISQSLNLPVEEVKSLLEELEFGLADLVTEEGFSQFVNQALGESEVNNLLIESSDLKNLTKLFEEINTICQESQEEIKEVPQISILSQVQEVSAVSQETAGAISTSSLEDKNLSQDSRTLKYESDESPVLGLQNESAAQIQDLGNTVPVHHFTTTTFTQNFTSGEGTVMQTVSAKTSASGEIFIEQIDFKVLGEIKELTMQLSPKELGDLNIKIVENNSSVVAEIKVENEKAKDLIQNEIHLLKENLEKQGINISEVKVDIRQDNSQSQMEQERQKSSKRIQEIISKHFSEELEEEEVSQTYSDSEVDYMV